MYKYKLILKKTLLVVYNLGVLGHFAPWSIFKLGGIRTFSLKKLDKKNCQNSQRFSNITSFHKIFSVLKCSNVSNIYYSQKIETFWSRDISNIWGIRTF